MNTEGLDSFDFQAFQDGLKSYQDHQDLFGFLSEESLCFQEEYGMQVPLRKEQNSGINHLGTLIKIGGFACLTENLHSQEDSPNSITQNNTFIETPNTLSPTQISKEEQIGNLRSQATVGKKKEKKQKKEEKEEKEKKEKKNKKDQMRNLFPNVIKAVIKKIPSNLEVYDRKLKNIQGKIEQEGFQYVALQQFKEYCQGLKSLDFSLRDIYHLLNFHVGSKVQKKMKKMFYQFFVWYLEKRYTIEIIKSDQCQAKEKYLRGKNLLRYLPELKPGKMYKHNKQALIEL